MDAQSLEEGQYRPRSGGQPLAMRPLRSIQVTWTAAERVEQCLLAYAASRDPTLREQIIVAYRGLADRLAVGSRARPASPGHSPVAPTSCPISAVNAIAKPPPTVTRSAARPAGAPPSRAPIAPNGAKCFPRVVAWPG
jgi:hypothetical protein